MGMDMRTKLKAITQAKGWKNQGEVAEFFHVKQSTASRWLSGKMIPEKHAPQIDRTFQELFGGIDLPERVREKFNKLSSEEQRKLVIAFEAMIDAITR